MSWPGEVGEPGVEGIPDTTQLEQTVALLNEAVSLDPMLWSLFDVMVPCAAIVGHATPIELMAVNDRFAMANALGLVNGICAVANHRIGIILENTDGKAVRRFAIVRVGPSASPDFVPDHEGLSSAAVPEGRPVDPSSD